jgi:hypothetical protein
MHCWGRGERGRLGLANTFTIGDNELPSSAPALQLGGVPVTAAGATYTPWTCVVFPDSRARCWGGWSPYRLGYGASLNVNIGDDEHPSAIGFLPVGGDVACFTSGREHICMLLTNGSVRCMGTNVDGQLGYPHTVRVGNQTTVADMGDVQIGHVIA